MTEYENSESKVEHPAHYNKGKIETIELIEDTLGIEGSVDFCIGNVIKYLMRCKHKGDMVTDVLKSQWYLNRAVDLLGGTGLNYEEEFPEFPEQDTFENSEDIEM